MAFMRRCRSCGDVQETQYLDLGNGHETAICRRWRKNQHAYPVAAGASETAPETDTKTPASEHANAAALGNSRLNIMRLCGCGPHSARSTKTMLISGEMGRGVV